MNKKPVALENLKADLVLDAIAKKEDLKVTKEETLAEMQKIADTQGATLHQVQKSLRKMDPCPCSFPISCAAKPLILYSALPKVQQKQRRKTEDNHWEVDRVSYVPIVVEQTSKGERSYDILLPTSERSHHFL